MDFENGEFVEEFYDNLSGASLDPEKVRKARGEEREDRDTT